MASSLFRLSQTEETTTNPSEGDVPYKSTTGCCAQRRGRGRLSYNKRCHIAYRPRPPCRCVTQAVPAVWSAICIVMFTLFTLPYRTIRYHPIELHDHTVLSVGRVAKSCSSTHSFNALLVRSRRHQHLHGGGGGVARRVVLARCFNAVYYCFPRSTIDSERTRDHL